MVVVKRWVSVPVSLAAATDALQLLGERVV
jgi:hypothetical protein